VLVDTTSDTLQAFGREGFAESAAIGVDLPASAQVSSGAVAGRLAIVDPDRNKLHLIDTAGLRNRPVAKPVVVDLPEDGRFADPVTTSNAVALVDQTRGELRTYDGRGKHVSTTKVPGDGAPPKPVRGEDDRIYVDSEDGSHLLVVNGGNGSVVSVGVGRDQDDSASETRDAENSPPPARQDGGEPPVAEATVPGAPGKVNAVAGDGSATVTWTAAAENGASIEAYHLSWSGGSTRVAGSARRATVTGLANGTSYVITVVAENAAGRGSGASAKPVTPQRSATAPPPAKPPAGGGPPTVTILSIRSHVDEATFLTTYIATVDAAGMGLPATCQAWIDFGLGAPATSTSVPCSGVTDVTIGGVNAWFGSMPIKVAIRTSAGTGQAQATLVPQAGGVFWFLPVAALAAKRRRKDRVS